jgi:hypothetical protein
MSKILIDFVAGTHGNFLEVILNQGFGLTDPLHDPFTPQGASHNKSSDYRRNKLFHADHWSLFSPEKLKTADKIISIRFLPEDLLLVMSISMLRAADLGLDNDNLEIDTVNKLSNFRYQSVLDNLLHAYPEINLANSNGCVPRNILREFYKFGFKDHTVNGYWQELQKLTYSKNSQVEYFDFQSFYDLTLFKQNLQLLEDFVGLPFEFGHDLYKLHEKFLSLNPYRYHKHQCDQIISSIQKNQNQDISKLTLFQESYINGVLENLYNKEMPFHDINYFTSTKDVLHYIEQLAPSL